MPQNTRLTDQEKIDIVNKYKTGKFTGPQLAKMYNRKSTTSIYEILRSRKIPRNLDHSTYGRKYSFDETFFDNIDSPEKAYFLGFLYADGCNGLNGRISIQLQKEDEELLIKLNKLINSNYPIYTTPLKGNHQESKTLTFTNRKVSNQLSKLGCISSKSLTLKFPTKEQVPSNLLRHFIRGYFDGDGHLGIRSKSKRVSNEFNVHFVGTENIIKSIQKTFLNQCNKVKPGIIYKDKKAKASWRLNISGTNNPISFLNWIYEGASIYMQRKYDIYQEVLKISV